MNKPLTVSVEDGVLRIEIGINTLAFATQMGDQWDADCYINDPEAFANSIEGVLCSEEEDGSTPVHRMLDSAAEDAYDGVEEGDVQQGIDLVSDESGIKGPSTNGSEK
jgi:hypothetical protein